MNEPEGTPVLPGEPSPAILELFRQAEEAIRPGERDELRERMEKEPYWFARHVLGNQEVFPEDHECHFKKQFDFTWNMGKKCARGQLNAPRNTLKTTIVACKIVHLIGQDRNVRILYLTNVHRNAMRLSEAVQRHLETNELLLTAYGPFKPDNPGSGPQTSWRSDFFFVRGRTTSAKEPTLTVGSVGQSYVGLHFDFIFVDDAVDQENIRSDGGIQATIDWYRLLPKLLDKNSRYGRLGCLLNQGTFYHRADLHNWLLGNTDDENCPADEYEKLVLEAMPNPESWDPDKRVFTDPRLNYPVRLPLDWLTSERKSGPYWFYTQYQNTCRTPEDAMFKPQWFRLVNWQYVPKDLRVHIFTDYSGGKTERSDRTAIWAVGLDWKRCAYCLDLDVGRWNINERAYRTIMYAMKYGATTISIEDVYANEGMLKALREHMERWKLRFKIVEIKGRSGEAKFLRITSLQPRFENKEIYFVARDALDQRGIKPEYLWIDKKGNVKGEMVDEFVDYGKAPYDDIPDALADIDKLDKKTKAHLFAGAPKRAQYDRIDPATGMVVNGRVQHMPTVAQQPGGYWKSAADSIRSGRGFLHARQG